MSPSDRVRRRLLATELDELYEKTSCRGGGRIVAQGRAQQFAYSRLTFGIGRAVAADAVPGVAHRILHLLPS